MVQDDRRASLAAQSAAQLALRADTARKDPAAFLEFAYRTPDGDPITLAWFHREWIHLARKKRRFLVKAMKGGGKSSLLMGLSLWEIGTNPNVRIKIACATDAQARKRVYEILENIRRNPLVKLVFPDLKLSVSGEKNKLRFTVERSGNFKDATVEAAGVLTSVSGDRADLVIADDICVTPDSEVVTETGVRLAEEVQPGDFVLAGDGRLHRVVKKSVRAYEGFVYRPRQGNSGGKCSRGFVVWGTPEHRIQTDTVDGWTALQNLQPGTTLVTRTPEEEWPLSRVIESLRSLRIYEPVQGHGGMSRLVTTTELEQLLGDPDVWRLIGYYLAEGWIAKPTAYAKAIEFVFNVKGTDCAWVEDLQAIAAKLDRKCSVSPRPSAVSIKFTHSVLWQILNEFGRGSSRKHLPNWALWAPRNLTWQLMLGYFRGDGTRTPGRETVAKSTSLALLQCLYVLLAREGFAPSIRDAEKGGPKEILGRMSNTKCSWSIRIAGTPFGHIGNTVDAPALKRDGSWSTLNTTQEGKQRIKVARVDQKHYVGAVINFEVEDVHSYSHGFAVSHNCDYRNTVFYPAMREVIKQKFTGEWLGCLEPGGRVWYIANPMHKADTTSYLSQTAGWTQHEVFCGKDDDPYAPVWPERQPRDFLIQKAAELGQTEYNRAYRGITLDSDLATIKPEWIHFYDAEMLGNPDQLICVQAYDLAIAQKKKSDFFAGVTLLYSQKQHRIFVADAFRDKLSFSEQAMRIVENAQRWRAEQIGIETVGYQDALAQYLTERTVVPLPIIPLPARTSKERRLAEVSPLFEEGRIYFNPRLDAVRNPRVSERGDLLQELLDFPLGVHDDQVDALVHAISLLRYYKRDPEDGEFLEGEGMRTRVSFIAV